MQNFLNKSFRRIFSYSRWPEVWSGKWNLFQRQAPVIQQLGATECGLACLAMILSYHGRKTKLSELRDYFDPGRDGTTALDITRAGRASGLRVKAYSLGPADFKYVSLPAIVHWNFNHFILVAR